MLLFSLPCYCCAWSPLQQRLLPTTRYYWFCGGYRGVFIAGLPAAALAYMGEEFEPNALLFAVGLYIGANSLGGVTGRLVSGLVAAEWGWRSSFLSLAAFDLICLFLVFWMLPVSNRFEPRPLRFWQVLFDLTLHLKNPMILAACSMSGLNFFVFINQYSYITFVLAEAPYDLSSDWLGLFFLTYLSGTLAAGHAKTARASATSLYLVFYYAGATLGGFYLEPFWRWAGWQGVVVGSLMILGITFGIAMWPGSQERKLALA